MGAGGGGGGRLEAVTGRGVEGPSGKEVSGALCVVNGRRGETLARPRGEALGSV